MYNLKTLDKICSLALAIGITVSGGQPFSNIVYKQLEKHYGVTVPSYNLSNMIGTVSTGKKILAYEKDLNELKIPIDSFHKLCKVLDSKGIVYKRIIGKDVPCLRIEGNHIHKFSNLLTELTLLADIKIVTEYGEKEAIVAFHQNNISEKGRE